MVLLFLVTRDETNKSKRWIEDFQLFLLKLDLSGGWEELEAKDIFINRKKRFSTDIIKDIN